MHSESEQTRHRRDAGEMTGQTMKINGESSEQSSAYVRFARKLWRGRMTARRFVPTSVLAAIIYLTLQVLLHILYTQGFRPAEHAFFWTTPVFGGLSLLPVFHAVNALFIAYVAMDFLVTSCPRKPRKLVHLCSYAFTLVVLGLFHLTLFQLGQGVADDWRELVRNREARGTLRIRCVRVPAGRPAGKEAIGSELTSLLVRLGQYGELTSEMTGVPVVMRGERQLVRALRRRAAPGGLRASSIHLHFHAMLNWRNVVSVCILTRQAGFQRVVLYGPVPYGGGKRQVEVIFDDRPVKPYLDVWAMVDGLANVEVHSEMEWRRGGVPRWADGHAGDLAFDRAVAYQIGHKWLSAQWADSLGALLRALAAEYRKSAGQRSSGAGFRVRVSAGPNVPFSDITPVLLAALSVEPDK